MEIKANESDVMVTPIKRDMVIHRRASMRLCKDCGKFYILSDGDAVHYITKYNSLPLRCEECRKRARDNNPYPVEQDDN